MRIVSPPPHRLPSSDSHDLEAPLEDSFDLSSLSDEFRDEARDQLLKLDAALLALEESGSLPADDTAVLLRDLHTLKGNAGMLGLRAIVDAVHAIEGVFKEPDETLPRDRLDLLFEAAAAVRRAVEQAGTDSQTDALARLTALNLASRLESSIADGSPVAPTSAENAPAGVSADTRLDEPPSPPGGTDAEPEPRPARAELRDAEGPDSVGELLRVPFAKLDQLLDQVGELTSVGASFEALLERHAALLAESGAAHPFAEVAEHLSRITRGLRSSTMEMRLVPVQRVFSRFPTLARDLAREQGKRVRVVLEGGDVELDKSMVDGLGDPLLHLIRNAVDHGIEPPEERQAAGKPATGTIVLRSERQGDRVRIEVSDDGEGLDRDALRGAARSLGIVGEHETLTPDETAQLIFRAGFSTRATPDAVSGRGIGLDAVRQRVTTLRGTLAVEPVTGGGTRFVISLPLTLAILPVIVFEAEGERFAVATVSVERTVRNPAPESAGAAEVLRYGGELIPVTRADRIFRWESTSPSRTGGAPFAVVIRAGGRRGAVLATRLLEQRDLVVKALPAYLGRIPAVSGASVAADGRIVLLLDPAGLLDLNLAMHQRENRASIAPEDPDRRG